MPKVRPPCRCGPLGEGDQAKRHNNREPDRCRHGRGVGRSGGRYSDVTLEERAEDALAGITYLRSRKDVAPALVGLVGHSLGGVIAPMVVARERGVGFVVVLGAPGLPGDEFVVAQTRERVRIRGARRVEGIPGDFDPDAVGIAKRLAELGKSELSVEAARTQFNADLSRLLDSLIPATIGKDVDLPGTQRAEILEQFQRSCDPLFSNSMKPLERSFLRHDPRRDWAQVRAPVLAVSGEWDALVAPALNLPPIEAALRDAGNRDVTSRIVPGCSHTFRHQQVEKDLTPSFTGPVVDPDVLDSVADWIRDHVSEQPANVQKKGPRP